MDWVCRCLLVTFFPLFPLTVGVVDVDSFLAYHLEKGHGGVVISNPQSFATAHKLKITPGKLEGVEKPYICPYKGCGKAYKNPNGLGMELEYTGFVPFAPSTNL